MKTMKVYRLEIEDCGDFMIYNPVIPINISKYEDHTIPRICCCPTIMGCITSLQIPLKVVDEQNDILNKSWGSIDVYLYSAEVDINDIYQPTEDQLPDAFSTGELWILNKSYKFNKIRKYKLRRHMDIPNTVYSRYAMTYIDSEEVLDVISAPAVYGYEDAFSFIEINPERVEQAIRYKEMNPDAYY